MPFETVDQLIAVPGDIPFEKGNVIIDNLRNEWFCRKKQGQNDSQIQDNEESNAVIHAIEEDCDTHIKSLRHAATSIADADIIEHDASQREFDGDDEDRHHENEDATDRSDGIPIGSEKSVVEEENDAIEDLSSDVTENIIVADVLEPTAIVLMKKRNAIQKLQLTKNTEAPYRSKSTKYPIGI